MFQNLFDTVSALVNNTETGDLDKAGQKLKTAASQAVAFVDTDQLDLIGLATDEIGLLELYKTTDSTTTTVSNYSGTCEVAALTDVGTDGSFTGTTEITKTNANALICGSNNQQNASPTTTNTIPYASRLRNQIILIQADNGYSNFKYVSRVHGAATEGDTSRRFNLGSSKYGTFTRSETSTQTVASFVGQLAPSIVQFGVAERDNYLHNDINLSLTLQGTVSTPTLSFSPNGFIKLVKSDNTVASTLNIVSGTANSTSGSLNVNGTAPGLKIEGILSASNVNEIAGTGAVNFTGSIYESTTNLGTDYRKLLEGRVTYNKTGSEVGTVKFVGELTVNQRKPVGVTLDVDLYGGLDGVSETSAATFYWDGNSFSLKDTGAGLVVTNSNGVKFTYVRGSASDIFVGSVNVGTIDANRRVSLKDGTFIQF